MKIPMPIATMLELPELIVAGCEGGVEIVMLSSLPDEDAEPEGAAAAPVRVPPPDLN